MFVDVHWFSSSWVEFQVSRVIFEVHVRSPRRLGVTFGSLLVTFGHFGVTFGHFRVTLGSHWGHFGAKKRKCWKTIGFTMKIEASRELRAFQECQQVSEKNRQGGGRFWATSPQGRVCFCLWVFGGRERRCLMLLYVIFVMLVFYFLIIIVECLVRL
jgi:hypothetical protein